MKKYFAILCLALSSCGMNVPVLVRPMDADLGRFVALRTRWVSASTARLLAPGDTAVVSFMDDNGPSENLCIIVRVGQIAD